MDLNPAGAFLIMNAMDAYKRGMDFMFRESTNAAEDVEALSEGNTYAGVVAAPQRNTEVDALALAFGIDVTATITFQRRQAGEDAPRKLTLEQAKRWANGEEALKHDGTVYLAKGVKHDRETITLGVLNHPDNDDEEDNGTW